MLSRDEAHKATGMKRSEITGIEEIPGGFRVHTHDGQYVDLDVIGDAPDPGPEDVPPVAVPDGSAKDVLAWVGEDPARAAEALSAENDRPQPRTTLVEALAKLVG